ncbi:TPA: HNH endonuclease signature motif containing protein [Salmonella enterica]
MKYEIILDALIQRAIQRGKMNGVYQERHHIIPVCLGGTNHFSNLVWLTPEEHYVVHHLLWRTKPLNPGIRKAWTGMNNMSRNNKEFGEFRRNNSTRMKELMSSDEQKERCRRQSKKNSLDSEVQKKRADSLRGYTWDDESRRRLSKSRKGIPHSEAHKANLTKSITERMRRPEERERYSAMWRQNNPMNNIQPWEHPTVVKTGKSRQWLLAGEFFEWWCSNGEDKVKNRYCLMLKETGLSSVCSKATAQTCISKFQKGWIPKEDSAWLKFYGDNNG